MLVFRAGKVFWHSGNTGQGNFGTLEQLLERWNDIGRDKEKARTVTVRAVANDY